jgi:hypothetical protein
MSSLLIPATATVSQLASAFSLAHVFSSLAPSALDVALSDASSSSDGTAFSLLRTNWAAAGSGAPNTAWVDDPFDTDYEGEVLRVTYPVGTRDGTQFRMEVFDEWAEETGYEAETAVLTYQVRFSSSSSLLSLSFPFPFPSLFASCAHSHRLPPFLDALHRP